jgi:hypothetical protein
VIAVGLAVAIAIGVVGIDQLARASQAHAAAEAALVADTVGARIEKLPAGERPEALRAAARGTGAELLVVTGAGEVVLNQTLAGPDAKLVREVLQLGRGEAVTARGRTRFFVHPLASG